MDRQILSPAQRSWLAKALDLWQSQGIISPEQGAQILDLYERPVESAQRQHSQAVFTLFAVAALLVALALFLVIGYNWDALPRAVKLVVIFGVLFGTHALGFSLRYGRDLRTLSEAVFFLGCLFYGGAIWLVAQVFNLNAHYPDGFWYWALGVLPFALCLDTLLLHLLLVALLAIWAGVEVLGFNALGGWFFGRWSFLPNGAYTLPLLALPGLLWAYRKNSPATVSLYAPLLAWWVVLQPFAWRMESNPVYFIGSVGGLFLLIAEAHPPGSTLAIPYRYYGVLLSGGVLIPLSHYEFNRDMLRDTRLASAVGQTLAIVAISVLTLVLTALLRRRSVGRSTPVWEQVAEVIRRQWLPAGMIAFMVVLSLWHSFAAVAEPAGAAMMTTVLANAVMVGLAFWLMRLGLREDRGQPFAAGVGYFLLWTVLRYVDLFGNFGGMLGAALMFFLCGAALGGVALYWRGRKGVRHV